ncbi:hypothetical protein BpHYR1_049421 [Brachionus plicatilis]|uniref:Uncharacterized protein n=1 Tax=Brachionus plicatilis TaxID=10195 RepID=A0A3M7QIY0_BRAPC|nr:hypothetical protein BpHYR1_049421 [Brachionus plicatilis]
MFFTLIQLTGQTAKSHTTFLSKRSLKKNQKYTELKSKSVKCVKKPINIVVFLIKKLANLKTIFRITVIYIYKLPNKF